MEKLFYFKLELWGPMAPLFKLLQREEGRGIFVFILLFLSFLLSFYPWVFRWTFSLPSHLQLLDAKTTFMDSVGWLGGGVGGWGGYCTVDHGSCAVYALLYFCHLS